MDSDSTSDANTRQWRLGQPGPFHDLGPQSVRSSNSYVLDRWTLNVNWFIFEDGLVFVRLTVLDRGQHYASVQLYNWHLDEPENPGGSEAYVRSPLQEEGPDRHG